MQERTLFHIHRRKPNDSPYFSEGMVGRTPDSENSFWGVFANESRYITFDNRTEIRPVRHAENLKKKQNIHPDELNFLAESLKEAGMLIREITLEEVRRADFPEKPSRRNCIWLTEENAIGLWSLFLRDRTMEWGNHTELDLIQLKCRGIFHTGNQSFLDNEIGSYNDFVSCAKRYWKGDLVDETTNNEILFSGQFEVISVKRKFC